MPKGTFLPVSPKMIIGAAKDRRIQNCSFGGSAWMKGAVATLGLEGPRGPGASREDQRIKQ
jgi:hypothetical protein